jgi:serralysin
MATFTAGAFGVDFDLLDLGPLAAAAPTGATSASVSLTVGGTTLQLFGSGFVFDAAGPPVAGTIARLVVSVGGSTGYEISGLSLSAATFRGWVLAGDNAAAKAGIFAGADSLAGGAGDDLLRGFEGADTIAGAGGANYLRGDGGDDQVTGGAGFDDINGNMGNDTARGGAGDDWVVGGKDNDLLFGEDGGDLVYGNLGDDTCDGGAGADIIRGGQANDVLYGGAGDDFLSGDRGDDTLTSGAGADIFNAFAEAGLDRVLDFRVSEGDRVRLDPGTAYTVAQVGADTVITLASGQVVLAGVSMSGLLADSIFVG